MKKCSKCKEDKSVDQFGKNKNTKDGLMYQCRECNNARVTAYNRTVQGTQAYIDYHKARNFTRHGITKELFDSTLLAQDGCAICHTWEGRLTIDHDHAHCAGGWGCAECFRGILCDNCNKALGLLSDDTNKLSSAIAYLLS